MKNFTLISIAIAATFYYIFARSGSGLYYGSAAMVIACCVIGLGVLRGLVLAVAFTAWHFAAFGSDSFLEFFVFPLVAVICWLYVFLGIPGDSRLGAGIFAESSMSAMSGDSAASGASGDSGGVAGGE